MIARLRSATVVRTAITATLLGGLLGACANPYALRIGTINYGAKQKAGVIQFTDPKLYKREALINERRTEIGYLEDLLAKSAKDDFKIEPEIVRELEVIRAFSGAVGLKFDPAGALGSRRATEVGDIEQRIQVTRLEMQLAQLQRDAELLRNRLATQTEPSAPPGTPPTTVTMPPAGPTVEDVTKILTSVEMLRQAVAARLDKKAEPAAKSSGTAGPLEEFRDRRAYRDAIKEAVNAASLDELHDKDGNSLFRVQLQATALPPGDDHGDTLGILRMEITPPTMTDPVVRDLYQEWLWYVNQNLNLPPGETKDLREQQLGVDPRLVTLGDAGGGLFAIVKLEIPKTLGPPPTPGEACGGVQRASRNVAHCWYPQVALPSGRTDGPYSDPAFVLDLAMQWPQRAVEYFRSAAAVATDPDRAGRLLRLDSSCRTFAIPESQRLFPEGSDKGITLGNVLALARTVHAAWAYLGNTLSYVADTAVGPTAGAAFADGIRDVLRKLNVVRLEARAFLRVLEKANPGCEDLLKVEPPTVADGFQETVRMPRRITVYEVAPTERTQRVSTVARAADAVAMAAALAGQLPQAGFAGSGNFAFTRTAIGKADALERAPLVVGFVEPAHATTAESSQSHPVFGWLLGPKVTLDPKKQRLVLQQHLAPYELHADVSLPGWWPYFGLTASSAWAPDWRSARNTRVTTLAMRGAKHERYLRVEMRHNAGDMDGLTALLLRRVTGQQVDGPRIRRVEPDTVGACSGQVTFAIEGEGIWRATAVHVGGRAVDASNIRVLPDMHGIAATVDVDKIPVVAGQRVAIRVWTHNGSDGSAVTLRDVRKADGTCGPATPPPAGQPTITQVIPDTISICDPGFTLTVRGRELREVKAVALGTIQAIATEVEPKDGSTITVKVENDYPFNKIHYLDRLTLMVRTGRGVATTPVGVKAGPCP